jgi:hypothetical protein
MTRMIAAARRLPDVLHTFFAEFGLTVGMIAALCYLLLGGSH